MMNQILLYSAHQSQLTDIIVWVLCVMVLVALIFLVFWQHKAGKELTYELEQLNKVEKHNVMNEFILQALQIATWHMDVATKELAYDTDFRVRTNEWIADADATDGAIEKGVGMLHEQDANRVYKSLTNLCMGKTETYHEEYRVRIPHTDKVYWEESYATVAERDENGMPKVVVGTSKRIDDRKDMEKALVDARNRAEESDRLKTAFIANMSHEIRTPLNAIVGFTSILPDVEDENERKSLLNLIQENTQKLLIIIDDVVNISKIESGKEELVMTEFDLVPTLEMIASNYAPKAKDGVEMKTQFATDSQMVTTDLNRFNEVLKHLMANAVKFTDHGTITLGFDAANEGRIRVWVKDTGKGIAKDMQERIFERFFKVDEFIPGAGLGLSICHTMAFSMGATVSVESELGKGSTFIFEFPIK